MKSPMFLTFALCTATVACEGDNDSSPESMSRTFTVQIQNVAPWTVLKSGTQKMKTTGMAGPAGPGEAFEITLTAGKGQSLSFATMLGESNDWFFAPGQGGVALYDAAGMPVSGDVTAQIGLWNAGTEVDEEPAVGLDTGPQQAMPTQGAPDSDPTVRAIGPSVVLADGRPFAVPAVTQMMKASLTYRGNQHRERVDAGDLADFGGAVAYPRVAPAVGPAPDGQPESTIHARGYGPGPGARTDRRGRRHGAARAIDG